MVRLSEHWALREITGECLGNVCNVFFELTKNVEMWLPMDIQHTIGIQSPYLGGLNFLLYGEESVP